MTGFKQILVSLFAVSGWLGATLHTQAETVTDLYVAEVPVTGQGDKARRVGITKAFGMVLVKVTGERRLPLRGELNKLVTRANSYVQQYSYRFLNASEADTDADAETAGPDRLLKVRFDEQAVNRQLRQHGIPVWGSSRPTTLIWLGIEQQGRRTLYRWESAQGLSAVLRQTARARGLPVVFPLMDLEDSSRLQASDVWGSFEEPIRRASDRYLPDVILVGRLRKRGGSDWLGHWSLYQPDAVDSWQSRSSSRHGVAAEGLQQAVDRLAERFAPRYVEQGFSNLRIRVSGLDHLGDYILVQEYLQSLGLIEQLNLLAAHPASISFIARVQGGREALQKGIMLGGVLEPAVSSDAVVRADSTSPQIMDAESLEFRLRQ
ncbi:MAG: DUF2066 domain-containing protein [Gammaproteobacteria bacterium]|nr:DUF2066 domain-containing protein [Gammaproteobacteria bacterium]